MSCATTQDQCIQKGASKTFCLTVLDDTGTAVDLTGATLYFTVAQTVGGTAVISKTSAVVTEIEILTQSGATLGQAKVYLQPSDTSTLDTSLPYVYDIWVELSSGQRYVVIAPSAFLVDESVTVIP